MLKRKIEKFEHTFENFAKIYSFEYYRVIYLFYNLAPETAKVFILKSVLQLGINKRTV